MSSVISNPAPGVIRLQSANPSPMTGAGTNTYIVEGDNACVLIDPGPALPAHHAALMAALDGRPLLAILVTHAHLDHSALARPLAETTGAPVLAFGDAASGRSAVMQRLADQGLTGGGEGADAGFAPDLRLHAGQDLCFAGRGFKVLHTPGHMGGHLCFGLGDLLFSGDQVMGWSTSLVSPPDGDMADYMASLDLLAQTDWRLMLPGHGAEITAPHDRLTQLIQHRRSREAAVLAALDQGAASAASLARAIYTDIATALLPAAARNILAHLIDLHARNLITTQAALTAESRFHRI